MSEERELTPNEEASITEGSKYLTTAKGYKSKFDMAEILVEGKLPEFSNTADKVACAVELGQFIKSSGWGLGINNLTGFLKAVDIPHRLMLIKQFDHPFSMAEILMRDGNEDLQKMMLELFDLL